MNALGYNVALTYDLRILHEIVNFPSFLEPLSLVTEFNFETMVNGDEQGETESFVTSGIVYSTDRMQVGVAFQAPLGENEVDFIVLPTLAFFYDEIIPALGKNLFP